MTQYYMTPDRGAHAQEHMAQEYVTALHHEHDDHETLTRSCRSLV